MAKRKRVTRPLRAYRIPMYQPIEFSLVSIPANAEVIVNSITKPIPTIVTQAHLGDATGLVDPRGVIANGFFPCDGTERVTWEMKTLSDIGLIGEDHNGYAVWGSIPHILGASYALDFSLGFLALRHIYSGPRSGGHRQRVMWSGGGDFCISDDCEGWDAVIASGTFSGTGVIVAKWRGSYRVWVSFTRVHDLAEADGGGTIFTQSFASGFQGEARRLFVEQVRPGEMPTRVFIDWLCETHRLPDCVVSDARACGFNPEKN